MNPIAARTDANQQEIVDALRSAGASVECLHAAGKGVPDLLVAYYGRCQCSNSVTMLMEVKMPDGTLNPRQKKWHAEWRGQVAIVRSVEEALALIGR